MEHPLYNDLDDRAQKLRRKTATPQDTDKEEFGEILIDSMRIVRNVYKRKSMMGRNPVNIDDLCSDVCVKIINGFQKYDPTRSYCAWVSAVAANALKDAARQLKVRARLHGDVQFNTDLSNDDQNFLEHVACSREPDPEKLLEHQEEMERVWRLIDADLKSLSPTIQETTRAYLNGMTQKEISKERGIPEGTAKSRVHTGMKHLQTLLNDISTPSR